MAIEAVLVDLDETLYQAGDAIIRTVDRRITAFIAQHTGMPWRSADRLRVELWAEFGTTARGLNYLFDISERDVNRFAVDAVDPTRHVKPDPALAHHLGRIPTPLYVFTNATRRYAERVLETLGVRRHFRRIFAIEFSLYNPKPSPIYYERVARELALPPQCIALVDDTPPNLEPGLAMGMRCVCVGDRGSVAPGVTRVPSFAAVPDALGF